MNGKPTTEFVQVIQALAENFNRECSSITLGAYWMGLDDVPIDVLKTAARTAIRSCKFMPTCAELRQLAGEPTPEDRAEIAWAAIEGAVAGGGYYHSVDFDCPLVNAAIRHCGGWKRFCLAEGDEFDKWLRRDFVKMYARLCKTGASQDAMAPLMGEHERHNRLNGYHLDPRYDSVRACMGLEPMEVATGLPALPDVRRIQDRREVPKVEVKRP